MKSAHSELVREEGKALGIVAGVLFVVLLVAFYKSGVIVALRMALALLWLFVVPGMLLLLFLREKLQRMERILIGSLLSAGVLGIASYYIGLIGFNVNYHYLVLPLVLDGAGIIVFLWHSKKKGGEL